MSKPALPFSPCREVGDMLYLSGEVPFADDGTIPEGIAAQTDLVLARISRTLATKDLTLDDVVSATVYLTDKSDFGPFNIAYARHFSDPLPVRTTLIADLVIPARLEITVVAKLRN
ncbi:RidA family protein [Azorhizobium caulinodans]|uniref:RidA family protein n=1 Tax=Azorhizobium caulinodans TaxID=7 RepID=UPI002FBD5A5C